MYGRLLVLVLVAGCGRIGFDEVGDDDSEPRTGPWVSVASGLWSSCGIANDQSLWCWGDNGYFQSASISAAYVPVTRVGTESAWAQVATAQSHSCAVKLDGTLWCWGFDGSGELGDGVPGNVTQVPARVGIDSDWVEVGTGTYFTCARKTTGTLWCWGANDFGALGDGMPIGATVAVPNQVGVDSDWTKLDVAPDSVCGVRAGGTAWCWGENLAGQLGIGVFGAGEISPVRVTGATGWKRIAVGDDHSCGIDVDKRLFCFGNNNEGQLGTNGTQNTLGGIEVVGGGSWRDVAVGDRHTCGVQTDDSLWCWGESARGQTGLVQRAAILIPELRGTGYASVSAYANNSCWLGARGFLSCMGDTVEGQRPDEAPSESAQLRAIDGPWLQLAHGVRHACGLKSNAFACWGTGWMGDGVLGDSKEPVTTGATFSALAAGHELTVALAADGTIWQWGKLPAGAEALSPAQLTATNNWDSVTAGYRHACAHNTANEVWCWGLNDAGQLGDGTLIDRAAPTRVPGTFTSVDAGERHTCAINAGVAFCWGYNDLGQLGTGNTTTSRSPIAISSAMTTWVQVLAMGQTSCARTASGFVSCWGSNGERELADGTLTASTVPVTATTYSDWGTLFAGEHDVCGLRQGSMWCWGSRHGLAADFLDATNVGAFVSYAGGHHSGCMLDAGGTRHCWGWNTSAQYGDGTGWSDSPWRVDKP